jgi:hypothetical protein
VLGQVLVRSTLLIMLLYTADCEGVFCCEVFGSMSFAFHAEVIAQMASMSGAAPGNNDGLFRNIHTSSGIVVGVVQPLSLSVLVPPSRAEIEAAIGFSRPDDSDSQPINALQSQVNILLRLFLSKRSWSSSPRLRSGSGPPLALSARSRETTTPTEGN